MLIHKQSPDIAAGVDCSLEQRRNVDGSSPLSAARRWRSGNHGGICLFGNPANASSAGCAGTPSDQRSHHRPKIRCNSRLRPDGKAQVTVEYDEDGKPFRLDTVVLSAQHSPEIPADELCFELTDKVIAPALQVLPPDEDTKIFNQSSRKVCAGRPGSRYRSHRTKTHGGQLRSVRASRRRWLFPVKDATKVDRSGAYMARYIAKTLWRRVCANGVRLHWLMLLGQPNR